MSIQAVEQFLSKAMNDADFGRRLDDALAPHNDKESALIAFAGSEGFGAKIGASRRREPAGTHGRRTRAGRRRLQPQRTDAPRRKV